MVLPIGVPEALEAMDALKGRNHKGFTGTIKVVVEIDPVNDGKSIDIKRRELRYENGLLVEAGQVHGAQIDLHN